MYTSTPVEEAQFETINTNAVVRIMDMHSFLHAWMHNAYIYVCILFLTSIVYMYNDSHNYVEIQDKVIKSKDTKYLHPSSSITAFIKGAIWLAYGIVDFDVYIMVNHILNSIK